MSLATRTYLVTGSTDGIGRHTCERLARAGANVFVHGRNPAKVSETVTELREKTTNPDQSIEGFVADLSSFDQVRQLASDVKCALAGKPLHVLSNNAGVFEKQKQLSSDGYELTWAVNVAAPFLLTSLLIDSVTERVVNVSSISAATDIDFNNLQQERGYSCHNSYSLSKLCNQLFNHQLAKRLKAAGSSVTANTLDPGTVNTKMLFAGWGNIGMPVSQADDQFFVATEPSLAGKSGLYFISSSERRSPSVAYDEEVQQRLWKLLEEQTGAKWNI